MMTTSEFWLVAHKRHRLIDNKHVQADPNPFINVSIMFRKLTFW